MSQRVFFIFCIAITIIWKYNNNIHYFTVEANMIYLLKSPYTEKLYHKIRMSVVNLSLITKEMLEVFQDDDILVVEDENKALLEGIAINRKNIIILGEADEDYRSITKFQSIEQIKVLLSDQFFPLYFCTSTDVFSISETQMYTIGNQYEIEYFICLNFNANSAFSLFKWSTDHLTKLPNKEMLYVINNINDLKNEPSSEILSLIESSRRKGNTMVFSFPLKSKLDFQILESTNILITLFKDKLNERAISYGNKCSQIIDVILKDEEIIYCDHK